MKASFVLALASTVLASPISQRQSNSLGFYVALQSTGILEIAFDPSQGVEDSLSIVGYTTNAGERPQWLTWHSSEDLLYTLSRTHYPDRNSESGGVFLWKPDTTPETQPNNLTLLDSESSNGSDGVYCDVSPQGQTLVCANIDGASVAVYPLSRKGAISSATKVFHYTLVNPGPGTNESQIQAFPHQSKFHPSGQYFVVPDRGSDRVYVYAHGNPSAVAQTHNISLPTGMGPRHVDFKVFNETRTYMVVIGELDNTIRVFTVDRTANGHLDFTMVETHSTLGPNLPPTEPNNEDLAAEVYFSNDGKFLYASNRNTVTLDSDTLAVFTVDERSTGNTLRWLDSAETLGKIPRHFALSSDAENQWVAVANEATQDIAVFERNAVTGLVGDVVGRIVLGEVDLTILEGPTCVLWKRE
jgi:6-phosphogluconolactonase